MFFILHWQFFFRWTFKLPPIFFCKRGPNIFTHATNKLFFVIYYQLQKISVKFFWSVLSFSLNAEVTRDPIIQQTMYFAYYGPTTFKILIACTEKGEIIYVLEVVFKIER